MVDEMEERVDIALCAVVDSLPPPPSSSLPLPPPPVGMELLLLLLLLLPKEDADGLLGTLFGLLLFGLPPGLLFGLLLLLGLFLLASCFFRFFFSSFRLALISSLGVGDLLPGLLFPGLRGR